MKKYFALIALFTMVKMSFAMMITQISATAGFDNFSMMIFLSNPSLDKNISGHLTCPPYITTPVTIGGFGDSVVVSLTGLPTGIGSQVMYITLWNQSGDTCSSNMILHTQTPGHLSPEIDWAIPNLANTEFDFQGNIFGKDTTGQYQWRIYDANDSLVWVGPWESYLQEEVAVATGHANLTGYPCGTYYLRLFAQNYWYPNGQLSEDQVPLQKGPEFNGIEEIVSNDAEANRTFIQLTGQADRKSAFFIKNRKLFMIRE